ncbi:telomere repeat-binding factor 1 [Phtheirospermum japonicum]|uniref:MYB transcription factor n=1 Tax=Phtheirospermum japonicum TaxID=374723 RepID=A0A830C4N3_9LAMI|nr:telomere repeat-binding factor 1 [Phtheirospermum japonicum]
MGAPKQKWTSEEEAALKAGIRKYGIGKWSTILKDPEFSHILRARSNVDLKDKYRNLNCMVLGSRQKTKTSNRSNQLTIKQDENTSVRSEIIEKESDVTSLAVSCEISQGAGSRKPISRMRDLGSSGNDCRIDDVILEAITKLKEPRGSNRSSIAQYINEHYLASPDLEKILAANLKTLTENRRLIKVKNQYRIAPKSVTFSVGKEPKLLENGGSTKDYSESKKNEIVLLTKAMIDAELEKMKSMSAEEAAKAAAQAVAAAEAAIAEAEAAAKEAEEAEAEAEAAQCFADAAQRALNFQTLCVW